MSSEVKEKVEERLEELEQAEESTDENLNENSDITAEHIEEEIEPPKKTKKNLHQELVSKVESSKERAKAVYEEYSKRDKELEEQIAQLIRQENNIVKTTIASSLELLKELEVQNLEDEIATLDEIKLDNKEQELQIQHLSKGTGKGLFFGVLTTVASIAGSFFVGAKLANLPLTANSILDKSSWASVSAKYAELLNLKQIPVSGYIAISVISLLLGYSIYKLITWMHKTKNVKYVKSLEKDLEEYTNNIEEKNRKIEDLIEHTEHIKLVMQKYDIILQEQNAKIRRMLFIEQPENVDSLQKASKLEVEKTVLILDELLKLMNTPINDNVQIKDESIDRLKSANGVINEVIKKLYI